MNLFDRFLDWISGLPEAAVFLVLGLSAFVENVFPPVPGDTITAFGAFLVGARGVSFWGVFLSTTVGSVAGFVCLFWIGARLGRPYFLKRDRGVFRVRDILKVEALFHRYGSLLVFLNRFFPGIRSAIAVVGGISRLPLRRVTVLAFLSAAIWNLAWIWMGYTLGHNWEVVRERLAALHGRYTLAILILVGLAALAILLRRIARGRRGGGEEGRRPGGDVSPRD